MKSVIYTFTTWDDGQRAAGFDGALSSGRQAVMVRQSEQKTRPLGRDNVVDLAAWRAANRELWEEQPELEPEYSPEEMERLAPARRARSRRRAHVDPELLATFGVIGVLAALMIRVLLF